MKADAEIFVTASDAARILGRSVGEIRHMAAVLPGAKKVGGRWRVSTTALRTLLWRDHDPSTAQRIEEYELDALRRKAEADSFGAARQARMESPAPEPPLITIADAATYLKLSSARVRKLASTGQLPARKGEDGWRVLMTDLIDFAQLRRAGGRPRKGGGRPEMSPRAAMAEIENIVDIVKIPGGYRVAYAPTVKKWLARFKARSPSALPPAQVRLSDGTWG